MAVSLSGDFKANLAQLPDVDGIESITLTFKDTGERCGSVRPASWRPCMCSRRGVYRRGFLNLLTGDLCADVIENKPGKSGSVKVYNYLLQQFPGLHKSIVELRTRATGRAGAPIPRSTKPRVLSPGPVPQAARSHGKRRIWAWQCMRSMWRTHTPIPANTRTLTDCLMSSTRAARSVPL